jgi:hypothetical protein
MSISRFSCLGVVMWVTCFARADDVRPFTQTLDAVEKQRLGLSALSPAQLAELDRAVGAYANGATRSALDQAALESKEKIQQAEKKAEVAAAVAVAEYKQKKEPAVIARTLDAFKHQQEQDKRERFTGHVVGEFRGWSGGTYFPLENGEVWRQVGTEINELPPALGAEVELFRSGSGYWRLKYGGSWITVKRLQ